MSQQLSHNATPPGGGPGGGGENGGPPTSSEAASLQATPATSPASKASTPNTKKKQAADPIIQVRQSSLNQLQAEIKRLNFELKNVQYELGINGKMLTKAGEEMRAAKADRASELAQPALVLPKVPAAKTYCDIAKAAKGGKITKEEEEHLVAAMQAVTPQPRRNPTAVPSESKNVTVLYFRARGQPLGAFKKQLDTLGVRRAHVIHFAFIGDILEVLVWRNRAKDFVADMARIQVMPFLPDFDPSLPFSAACPEAKKQEIQAAFLRRMKRGQAGSANAKADQSPVVHQWMASEERRVRERIEANRKTSETVTP